MSPEREYNPLFSWKDCTDDGISKYTNYLLREKKITSGTANVRIIALKSFLNHCTEKNIVSLNESYKKAATPKTNKAKVRYLLSKEQLVQYSRFNFTDKRQSLAQKLFLFATLTAQRISDVWQIKPENIVNNIWYVTQQKTNIDIEIPLTDKAVQILKETNYFAEIKIFAARSKSLQPYNRYANDLKQTFRAFGLVTDVATSNGTKQHFETISWHDSRAIFSTLCQEHGYSDGIARTITGHQSKDTLGDYQKTSNQTKLKMLNDIFQGL